MQVSESKRLNCTIEDAWRELTDWESQAEWMADADSVSVEGARAGVGATVRVRTRLYNVPAFTERLEVTTWDPPRRLDIAHRSIVKGVGVWKLEPDGDGVVFTWTEDVTLPVVGDLVAGIYRPFLRKMMRASLEALAGRLGSDGT